MSAGKGYRAGSSIEDYCRACKMDRMHTVIAAGPDGRPIRVACGYCRSEHNYRGGPRTEVEPLPPSVAPPPVRPTVAAPVARPTAPPRPTPAPPPRESTSRDQSSPEAFPLVSDRERIAPEVALADGSTKDLEMLLRRVIREETGLTSVAPADKWRGGSLVLRPGTPGLQEKSWPIETFFHKIVMVRNRLRSLEQQVNASNLPEDVKVRLQAYVSGCYGSLTSFNVLFANDDDLFKGTGGE
jgi:hypothetical protein